MLADGTGFMCRVDGGVNAELYQTILGGELMQTLEWYGLEKKDIWFQQDNASCHTAASTRQWFEDNGIRVLKWPAQSPDINPIEHLWDRLKKAVRELPQANNLDKLWDRVQTAWEAIQSEDCRKLVASMPERLAAVKAAKDGYTRY
jgi:DDE superfamily endonuclease